MGLYCKISIVLFYVFLYLIYLIFCDKNKSGKYKKRNFKLFSIKRYFRYIKILFCRKVIKIIVIFSIISNTCVLYLNNQYENTYKTFDGQECKMEGIVLDNQNDKYKIKIKITNNRYKNTNLYLYCKNKNLEYGDKIYVEGIFLMPQKQRNYKGFDQSKYYKTIKIYGSINVKNVKIISKNNGNILIKHIKKLSLILKEKVENLKIGEEEKALLKGILLGDKENISKTLNEDFSNSNLSHILAVSGMHVAYIILFSNLIFNKIIGKHYSKIASTIVILIYMCIVNFTPSVVRAGVTGIIAIMANFVYRKNDIIEAMSIAIFIILINNPYSILNVGMQLSFAATLGIIVFDKTLKMLLNDFLDRNNRTAIRKNRVKTKFLIKILNSKIFQKILDALFLAISATIGIEPIVVINFYKITFTSLIISCVAGFIVGPIIILGIFVMVFKFELIENLLNFSIKILIYFSKLGEKIPFNKIYLKPPGICFIIFYYIIIFGINCILKIKLEKNLSVFQTRIENLFSLMKYKVKLNKSKFFSCILIICILSNFYKIIPHNLRLYIVDVGQGDCTLIITPKNKSILIDGGGSEFSDFNVGKNILMPYLLNRNITTIDYMIFSHFDSDHCQGLLYVLENMKVKNIIIGKQYEKTENYKKFVEIVRKNNKKVLAVDAGNRINIEKGIYFDILWPSSKEMISENAINNNSLVCKLVSNNISVLFTGDIEAVAEKSILNAYKNNLNMIKSDYLKVAHHGSKTSSTVEFLNAVKPKVAIICVGKNNKFGHPSEITLENLQNIGAKIFRTDKMGEIIFKDGK